MTLPYDGTDTWGPTWNSGQDISWAGIFSGAHPQLQLEYRNAVRELRDLLFQPDQINPLIDAFARPLRDVAIADHVRWSNAPAPANYRSVGTVGGQAAGPGNLGGLAAYVQDMKNFMFVGGNYGWWLDRNSIGAGGWITRLDTLATDAAIPARPTVTYAGVSGFPVNGLVFQSSPFSDPQGSNTIAATQWRIAEITPAGTVISNPALLKLEWEAAWDSGEIPGSTSSCLSRRRTFCRTVLIASGCAIKTPQAAGAGGRRLSRCAPRAWTSSPRCAMGWYFRKSCTTRRLTARLMAMNLSSWN